MMLVVCGEVGRCFGGPISNSFDEFGIDVMVARFVGGMAELWEIHKAAIPK